MHSPFASSANTCASRSRQINNLSLTYLGFLTWIKCQMISMRAGQEGQTADVTRSCCHAFYSSQKHDFIVSEGHWLLSWNFQNGSPAFITLKVMKDGYSLVTHPFLSDSVCRGGWVSFLSHPEPFSLHLPPWNVTKTEKVKPLSVCSVGNLTYDSWEVILTFQAAPLPGGFLLRFDW